MHQVERRERAAAVSADEHPNAAKIRDFYGALARGELPLKEYFAEDLVWVIPGHSAMAGEHRGLDAARQVFARLSELSGGTFRVELIGPWANDRRGVAYQRTTASRGDEHFEMTACQVVRYRDGKAAEVRDYYWDLEAHDAFWCGRSASSAGSPSAVTGHQADPRNPPTRAAVPGVSTDRDAPREEVGLLAARTSRSDHLPTSLAGFVGRGASSELNCLSPREREVLRLLERGYSNRQIADNLVIGVRTAETHVQHILRKLDLDNRAQAILWSREHAADPTAGASPADRTDRTSTPPHPLTSLIGRRVDGGACSGSCAQLARRGSVLRATPAGAPGRSRRANRRGPEAT